MCASPLSFLRAGPPPPKVVLLPDAMFFTRALPVAGAGTSAEVAAQIELGLEAVSPFALAQLYYGWVWAPGSEHAFVFAAYRRRFTTDQTAEWSDAELVLPTFAALFGAEVEPSTTIILSSAESLTAIHWDKPPVPAKVIVRALDPEATDEDRARVRDDLLRAIGGSKNVIDLVDPPVVQSAVSDRDFIFRSGEIASRLPAITAAAVDVRDKGELAALRSAKQRDVMFWRITLGCAAALVVLGLGELALLGGDAWQRIRITKLNSQRGFVEKIKASNDLARRIEDLAKNRLLPFEMISLVGVEGRRPAEIQFMEARSSVQNGIYSLTVRATATNTAQISVYKAALEKVPEIESAEVQIQQTRGDTATFDLLVKFKPQAISPATSISE